jgi:dTDP-4-dehydrorhamnose 3,5-epimerase
VTFEPTPLDGAYVIEPQHFRDERGFFAYTFDLKQFDAAGLHGGIVQSNISFNHTRGTLRGMHYQSDPVPQPKLVRCTSGSIYDVIVDLRPASPTHRQWFGVELSSANHLALYIPAGFAHGFQTFTEDAEVLYEMFAPFAPETARGVRYDDPAFGIRWPLAVTVISERDRKYPDYTG